MKERLSWIDVMKGIGIILVVFGHATGNPKDLTNFIFAFHMPLFFFISGFVFSDKNKDMKPLDYLRKKARSLLVPYFFFALTTFAFWALLYRKFSDAGSGVSIAHPFLGIFYSIGENNWLIFDTPLWFLTCLFVVEVLFYAIIKSSRYIAVPILVLSVLGYLADKLDMVRLPWSTDTALTAIAFYGIGYLLKSRIGTWFQTPPARWVVMVAGFALVYGISLANGRVDMNGNQLGNYFYLYAGALAGIAATIGLSKLINKNAVLEYLGKNSLVIMSVHFYSLAFLNTAFEKLHLRGAVVASNVVIAVLALMSCTVAIYVLNRWLPFVLGKPRTVRKVHSSELQREYRNEEPA